MLGRLLTFTLATLMITASTIGLSAHPGHEHKVLGTVTMIAADHVMVKDKDGKDATVTINKSTKFVRAKKGMKATDMKVGMRIVITAVTDENDDKSVATVIQLGADPATK